MNLNKKDQPDLYPILTLGSLTKLTKDRKRVGRGIASGLGKTCGRGYNGALSRTGSSKKQNGGQTPVYRRFPKTGFVSHKNKTQKAISVETLAHYLQMFAASCDVSVTDAFMVDVQWLRDMQVVKGRFNRFRLIMGKNNIEETDEDTSDSETPSTTNKPILSEEILILLKKTTIVASGFSKTARAFLEECGATLSQDTSKDRQKLEARKEFFDFE